MIEITQGSFNSLSLIAHISTVPKIKIVSQKNKRYRSNLYHDQTSLFFLRQEYRGVLHKNKQRRSPII